MTRATPPLIAVHGGAADSWAPVEQRVAACREAARIGLERLQAGASAVEAVTAAVSHLEDDPWCNAGTGAVLNVDGRLELDACIMDGSTLASGAVGALPPFRNPIQIARALMEQGRQHLLVADGAAAFARAAGFTDEAPERMIVDHRREEWRRGAATPSGETVGAVALDVQGGLAAGTSTGGLHGKAPGRLGDTPIVGAGTYADELAACSCTGTGEAFARACAAFAAVSRREEPAQRAAEAVLRGVEMRFGGSGGVVLVRIDGEVGVVRSANERMPYAVARAGAEVTSGS